MRRIDADALIEGYKRMGYDPAEHTEESYMEGWCKGFNAAVDHCMHHVIHAPTIEEQKKGEWIPVSERQPEEDGMYYVTVRDSEGNIDAMPCLWFFEKWGIGGVEVIAWIEIPEPYQEGE